MREKHMQEGLAALLQTDALPAYGFDCKRDIAVGNFVARTNSGSA